MGGKDDIRGGEGNNTLDGGEGSDTFGIFNDGDSDAPDTIEYFSTGADTATTNEIHLKRWLTGTAIRFISVPVADAARVAVEVSSLLP